MHADEEHAHTSKQTDGVMVKHVSLLKDSHSLLKILPNACNIRARSRQPPQSDRIWHIRSISQGNVGFIRALFHDGIRSHGHHATLLDPNSLIPLYRQTELRRVDPNLYAPILQDILSKPSAASGPTMIAKPSFLAVLKVGSGRGDLIGSARTLWRASWSGTSIAGSGRVIERTSSIALVRVTLV
eukprot:CAMPEP_0118632058 /NCGR_PEP_ID=MMETSP0785-20121206/237_1 /TAXON_ID=91992 /ORGANISM="Bolidomonas pacifica, Strain CCMP 1866" /LENGTH=184 /DNA_ID=CAMNT_0006522793 /DNA_START=1400 /DNA_END=1955 /DNA_ORIENTATION=-